MKSAPRRHKQPFRHKKHLGQNFLKDKNVLTRIVSACDVQPTDHVIEIGPGQGALTGLLAAHAAQVTAIEKDRRLIPELKLKFEGQTVDIIEGDFLEFNFASLDGPRKLIGNIPYYITTPIVEKLIQSRQQMTCAYLMVQWEYGQRLKALPKTREYGSLTCFVNYYADIEVLFKIKRTCFQPVPKVDSCFLRMTFLPKPRVGVKNERLLFEVIQKAFQQRRKTLLNALNSLTGKSRLIDAFHELGIKENARGEELGLEEFARIADWLEINVRVFDRPNP